MSKQSIFHLAFPVINLDDARQFYHKGIGCTLGRSSQHAQIFNFFGHQLIAHLIHPQEKQQQKGIYPRHFGLVCKHLEEWKSLYQRALDYQLCIYSPARLRFPQQDIENHVFFLKDPSDNLIEFKHYTHKEAIFSMTDLNTVGERSS